MHGVFVGKTQSGPGIPEEIPEKSSLPPGGEKIVKIVLDIRPSSRYNKRVLFETPV